MRFSIYLNPQTPGPDHDRRIIKEVLGHVDLAEQLGFTGCWLTEHHFTGYNAYSDPLILAAGISQRNSSLRLGFSVAVAPLHNPVRFLTQCNLIDQLSDGKFTIGVGAGNAPDEFKGYGGEAAERHAMMDEWYAALDAAWDHPNSSFGFDGSYYKGEVNGRVIPAAVSGARPHVAVGSGTASTIEMAGRKGWSILLAPYLTMERVNTTFNAYLKGLDAGNLTEEQRALAWAETGYMRQVYVAAEGEDWRKTLDPYLENYVISSMLANFGKVLASRDEIEERKAFFGERWLFAGTPSELIAKLTPYAKLGIGHMMCWFAFGYQPDELVRRTILRFASEVMPTLGSIPFDPDFFSEVVGRTEQAPALGYSGVI